MFRIAHRCSFFFFFVSNTTYLKSKPPKVLICKPGWGLIFFRESTRQGFFGFFSLCSYVVNKMFAEKTHTQVFMFERNVAVLKHTHACVQKNPVRCCVLIVCQTFGACTLQHCLIGRSKVQWAPTRLGLSAHLGSVGQEAGHRQECVRPGSTMSKSALSASLSSGSSAAVARLAQPQFAPFKKKKLCCN